VSLPDLVSFSEMSLLRSVISNNRRTNIMVVSAGVPLPQVVDQVRAICPLPCQTVALPGALDLTDCRVGTLLLHDVADLAIRQQLVLSEWMEREGRNVQIVSVTRSPLVSLVHDGRFLEGLFYRLNTLYVTAKRNA
jgi:hypothetical protein